MGIGVSARNGRRISTTWGTACFDGLFARRSPSQCCERHGLQSRLLRRPGAPTIEPPKQASSYSDAELKSCALAARNVQRIKDVYLQKLEAAKTPEQEQEVRKAAAGEMARAIESEGMTVGQYTQIANQVQESPELAKRVQEHVKNATK